MKTQFGIILISLLLAMLVSCSNGAGQVHSRHTSITYFDEARDAWTPAYENYPYYLAEDLRNECVTEKDTQADVSFLNSLNKVIVFPTGMRKSVAGFADAFLKQLEYRGWRVVDSINAVKSRQLIDDIENPDIIVFYMTDFHKDSHFFYKSKWLDLHHHSALKVLISEDLNHSQNIDLLKFFAINGDAILARYPEGVTRVLSTIKPNATCYDFHHATTDHFTNAFKNFETKKPNVLVAGALTDGWYPLRIKAFQLFQKSNNQMFLHRPHPGYKTALDPDIEAISFARQISDNMISVPGAAMGSLPAPYILAKTFEIPATGSIVVMDDFVEPLMNKLGFEKNIHYLSSNPDSLEQDLNNWLLPKNQGFLSRISAAGRRLVLEKHTLENRVWYFEKLITNLYLKKKRG